MRSISVLGLVLLFAIGGCASVPMFPANGTPVMDKGSDFGVLEAKADTFKGQAMKLAGRMIGVRTEGTETVILAEWLPYPSDQTLGPNESMGRRDRLFTVRYPGPIDSMGTWKGNKFLAVGQVEGTSGSLPSLLAKCLRVWKSGEAPLQEAPDVEFSGYPVLSQTYCTNG